MTSPITSPITGTDKFSDAEKSFLGKFQQESAADLAGYTCHMCSDRGYTLNNKGEAVQCDCERKKMYAREYEKAGIPPVHYHWSFHPHWNLKQDAFGDMLGDVAQKKKQVIQKFLERYQKALPNIAQKRIPLRLIYSQTNTKYITNLMLVGGSGSGKSLLASIVAQNAVRQGIQTRYYDFLDILATLRDFSKTDEQDTLTMEWGLADYVVLDGVTGEYHMGEKGPFKMTLDRLCRTRINLGKPILITAAVDYKNLEGGSTWKSLVESCYIIDLPSRER